MNEHDKVRELLALAAAGALIQAEEEKVARHVRSCEACSEELNSWQSLAGRLQRLPTPQPSAALLQRTIAMAEAKLAEEAEYRWQRWVMVFVVTFAWIVTIASWPIVRLFTSDLLTFVNPRLSHAWLSFAAFTTLVWLAGGSAAVLLSLHQRRERRLA
jgi:predicted anti-sigma-YlaC factor YlaD